MNQTSQAQSQESDPTPAQGRIKIVAITRKPDAGSFVQRIANNIAGLQEQAVDVTVQVLPKSPIAISKLISTLDQYDGIWWQRHLLQGPFRWMLSRVGKPVVLDYDDPIYMSSKNSGTASWVRYGRFRGMLRLSAAVFCGSRYLAEAAEGKCDNVIVVPMPVAVEPAPPSRPRNRGKTTLYWFGSKATMPYLQELVEPLEELGNLRNDITLRVVGHGGFSLKRMKVEFVQWSPDTEKQGLAETDIGLCPMPNTPWTQGKCPYKVLCYMANAMPWVGSAVGENIFTAGPADRPDQSRGFVAENKDQWIQAIIKLVDNPGLMQSMGLKSHAYILEHHERSRLVKQQAQAWREIIGKAKTRA